MKLNKIIAAAALASASSLASAVPAFVVPGGQVVDPFGGFDWVSNGTAYTNNFNFDAAVAGTSFNFDMTYFARARGITGILDPGGNPINVLNLVEWPNGSLNAAQAFELTIVATFNETASCTNAGTQCSFSLNSGSFAIYIDLSPDAATGAGAQLSQYTDGDQLIWGSFNPASSGTFSAIAGSGSTSLFGTVTGTNNTYINPSLIGTTAVGTLQIGNSTTGWVRPTQVVGAADTCAPGQTSCSLAFQADSNQNFSVVPEPASLALLGLGLAGLGYARRRQSKA